MKITALLLTVACAAPATDIPSVRFANAPIAYVVNDRRDVPHQPKDREFLPIVYHYDGFIQRRISRALELPRQQRALGVNAIDEVPDSTWFTNRVGVRDVPPDEVRDGPLTTDSPEQHLPWKILHRKVGGTSVGFVVKDARGMRFLLKFDSKGNPEIETATHVIVNRLLWAAGYNVAEDRIVQFRRGELVSDDPNIARNLDRDLAGVEQGRDGRIRGLASRWIEGKPVGGHPAEGVRDDDVNDRIPHELRRDLRGAYPIFAWLDHVDVQEGNFVDSWVADRADAKRHYLRHYLIDFGKSLGAMAYFEGDLRRGHHYLFDFPDMLVTFVTLGAVEQPWQRRATDRPASLYDAATFDPGAWHPDSPAYVPFLTADDRDKYWGAKIVARFTRAQLRAAVDAGELSDPRVAAYLVDTLVARQSATAAYWFARTSPIDHFAIDGDELCFDDLAVAGGYARASHVTLRAYDWHGKSLAAAATFAVDARTCRRVPLAPADDDGGYTILRFAGPAGETYVHVGRDPGPGTTRVIGVWRP